MRRNSPEAIAHVVKWMKDQLRDRGVLRYSDAAIEIRQKFGKQFTRDLPSGKLGIARDVVEAFKIHVTTAIWCGGPKAWRRREASDGPGRRQRW